MPRVGVSPLLPAHNLPSPGSVAGPAYCSEDHPDQPVEQRLEGEQSEEQGQEGGDGGQYQLQEHVPAKWHGPDLLDDGVGVAQIGEGLDIGGAEQGFPVPIGRAQPSVLETAAVFGREGAIFPQPLALGLQNMRGEDRQGSQHEQQAETGEQYDLRLVGGQHGGVMEDPVGDEPGKLGTQGEIVNILLKIKNSFLPTKQILIGL